MFVNRTLNRSPLHEDHNNHQILDYRLIRATDLQKATLLEFLQK